MLRPRDPIRALLAIANLVLRRVAPRLLTEAVLDGVEAAGLQVKEVVDVVVHLDVGVQVHNLLVLDELHTPQ
jgi:hypothetical protein